MRGQDNVKIRNLTDQMKDVLTITQDLAKSNAALQEAIKKTSSEMKEQEKAITTLNNKGVENLTILGQIVKRLRATKGVWAGIHRIGYNLPLYFRIKNQADVAISTLDTFLQKTKELRESGEGGIVGNQFERAKLSAERLMGTHRSGAKGRGRRQKDELGRFSGGIREGFFEFFGSKKFKNVLGAVGELFKSPKNTTRRRALLDKMKEKSLKFHNSMNKLSKLFIINGLAFFMIVGKALLFATLAIVGLWMLWKASGLTWDNIKSLGKAMWESVKFFAGIMWDGLQNIWEGIKLVYKAFGKGGEIEDLLLGLWKIFGGLVEIALGLLGMLVVTALIALGGILVMQLERIIGKIEKSSESVYNIFKTVVGIGGLILMVVGAILGLPVMLAGLTLMLVSALLDSFNPFGRASGGVASNGMNIVGERGPELVKLPAGSRVYSNSQSKKMVSNGGGNNITVNVQGRIGASDSELRQIAEKVGRIINKEINRTTSSGTTR